MTTKAEAYNKIAQYGMLNTLSKAQSKTKNLDDARRLRPLSICLDVINSLTRPFENDNILLVETQNGGRVMGYADWDYKDSNLFKLKKMVEVPDQIQSHETNALLGYYAEKNSGRIRGYVTHLDSYSIAKNKFIVLDRYAKYNALSDTLDTDRIVHFNQSARDYVIEQHIAQIERDTADIVASIEKLDTVPATWQLTQKEYLESVKNERVALAEQRDENRKKITRLRNRELSVDDTIEIESKIQSIAVENNYQLPADIREYRLKQLLERVFEEDQSEQFYPTPIPIVRKMIQEANIQSGMRILEPSAGKGNIADLVREMHPDVTIECIEINAIRAEILRLKGYKVYEQDALTVTSEQAGTFDRVLMNPPFLKTLGAKHVRYMFDNLLKPEGRLVALLNAGAYSDGNDLQAVQFKRFVDKYGKAVGIDKMDYNVEIERAIGIHIGMFVVDKPQNVGKSSKSNGIPITVGTRLIDIYDRQRYRIIAVSGDAVSMVNEDTGSQRSVKENVIDRLFQLNTEVARDFSLVRKSEIDTTFREPSILTARQQFTQKSPANYVPEKFENILKYYQKDGVNLAIHALDGRGGFLLTDGTGTGKTMQEIVVAYTLAKKHNKPAIILTESDQIIQQSFFGDARRLGFSTPDAAENSTKVYKRTWNYKGLYDNQENPQWEWVQALMNRYSIKRLSLAQSVRNEIEMMIDALCAFFGKTAVYSTVASDVVMRRLDTKKLNLEPNTIYVGTYNDLSNSDLNDSPEVLKLDNLRKQWKDRKEEYKEERKRITASVERKTISKDEATLIRKQIASRELNDPLQPLIVKQENIIEAMNKSVYGKLAEQSAVIIYDECHNLKNTADAKTGSFRAMRGRIMSEAAPRVMFVSATPADKAGDLFYLKECGLYQYPKQFARLMTDIGFEFKPEKFNDKGELIRRSLYAPPKNFSAENAAKVIAREFDRLTEDGQMLKREIELANLEPVRMVDVPIDDSIVDELMVNIAESLIKEKNKQDEEEGKEGGSSVSKSLILMEQKRALEAFKIEATVEHTLRELSEGRSVVVFVDMVEEGEKEKAWGGKKVGTAQTLKSRLAERIGADQIGFVIGVKGDYEKQERLRHIREFQEGKRRVMIATVGSGGTGISLDDTVGNLPRTIVIVTAPMSSIKAIQVIGRVVRANTKSRSRVLFLFADTAIDEWLKNLLATKIMMLGGVVSGQVSMMQPSEVEALESGGDESFAGASASTEGKNIAVTAKKHSLWNKENVWLDGREYPRQRGVLVGKFSDTLSAYEKNRRLIRIKSFSKGEIDRFGKEYATTLETYGFKRTSDRFNGTFYEALATDESWLWAINLLSEESASVTTVPDQLYQIGDMVQAAEDITNHNIAFGTSGRIVTVRPRNGYYLYDVQFGEVMIKSLAQEALASGNELTDKSSRNGIGQDIPFEIITHLKKQKLPFLTAKEAKELNGRSKVSDQWYVKYLQLLIEHNIMREDQDTPLPELLAGLSPEQISMIKREVQNRFNNAPEMNRYNEPTNASAYYNTMSRAMNNQNRNEYWQYQKAIAEYATERLSDEDVVDPTPKTAINYPNNEPNYPDNEPNYPDNEPNYPNNEPVTAEPQTKTYSLTQLAHVKGKPITLPPEWRNVLGNVELPFIAGVYGMAGNGKSSAMLHLSQHLAKHGKVLFVNAEESPSVMANRVRELGVNVPSDRFAVLFTNDMQTMLDAIAHADIVIVDSIGKIRTNRRINNREMKPVDYIEWLKSEYPTKTFIVLLHSLKSGASYKGDSSFGHDPDILLQVQNHTVATVKNRFGTYGEFKLPKPKGKG
jgi:hypothetical protein